MPIFRLVCYFELLLKFEVGLHPIYALSCSGYMVCKPSLVFSLNQDEPFCDQCWQEPILSPANQNEACLFKIIPTDSIDFLLYSQGEL